MKVFDNITEIVRDDMISSIEKKSKVSIAAACFSIFAYEELKKQLESLDEFRFIFTSPTFVKEKENFIDLIIKQHSRSFPIQEKYFLCFHLKFHPQLFHW